MDGLTYRDAGVDVEEGQRAVELMKQHVKATFNKSVLTGLGGFGGLFKPDLTGLRSPVLVAGTDGVGTKLKLAFMTGRHDTIGQDCVAMCVNDILCQGAKPLFFLDYIASGRLQAERAAEIVGGIARGCQLAGCALIGGETAEMPGFYPEGEYDVAGFALGIVDEAKIITGADIEAGDVIIGIASSGLHSNGYSLVRKLFFQELSMTIEDQPPGFSKSLGEVLLTPTKIYVKPVLELIKEINVKGLVHITGGGFYENVPRILPGNVTAAIQLGTWEIPQIFQLIQEKGKIDEGEMYKTFNMGIGMMAVVRQQDAEGALEIIRGQGEAAEIIGQIVEGDGQVMLCRE
ncbi:phosphoribosylformylglycinamidine cyclo-ligase [Alkaliphilus crotonatoxidans]